MKNITTELRKKIQEEGLESLGLFYATYAGVVEDNQDPDGTFRLKLKVPEIYGEDVSDWALPRGMFNGSQYGIFALPQKGDNVWVTFRNGNPRFPIWEYGAVAKGERPCQANDQTIAIISKSGCRVVVDDSQKLVSIEQPNGYMVQLGDNGIKIGTKDYDLRLLFDDLFDWIKNSQVLTPAGNGKFDPASLTSLENIKANLPFLSEKNLSVKCSGSGNSSSAGSGSGSQNSGGGQSDGGNGDGGNSGGSEEYGKFILYRDDQGRVVLKTTVYFGAVTQGELACNIDVNAVNQGVRDRYRCGQYLKLATSTFALSTRKKLGMLDTDKFMYCLFDIQVVDAGTGEGFVLTGRNKPGLIEMSFDLPLFESGFPSYRSPAYTQKKYFNSDEATIYLNNEYFKATITEQQRSAILEGNYDTSFGQDDYNLTDDAIIAHELYHYLTLQVDAKVHGGSYGMGDIRSSKIYIDENNPNFSASLDFYVTKLLNNKSWNYKNKLLN